MREPHGNRLIRVEEIVRENYRNVGEDMEFNNQSEGCYTAEDGQIQILTTEDWYAIYGLLIT